MIFFDVRAASRRHGGRQWRRGVFVKDRRRVWRGRIGVPECMRGR